MRRFIDLIGQKFNELIPIRYMGNNKWGNALWLCRCDCGKEKIILGSDIKRGRSKNCGCSKLKHCHARSKKISKTYKSWDGMIQRCTNPKNASYENYGGRGITICDRWLESNGKGFINFLADMGERPEGKSLDRRDNNKLICGYSPGNCKWSTKKEQANNRRSNLDKKSLLIRKYKCILMSVLNNLKSKRINFSKHLPYGSRELCEHLNNILKVQNNCCPMCNKSYNDIKFDIDHIIPTSSAKTKEDLLKLFDLNNLSLLCFYCNRYVKRNKIKGKINEK